MKLFGIRMNKKTLVRWKIYLDRARMYLQYINFGMIAFVFLDEINDVRVREMLDENRLLFYPLVMILFMFISLILGYLDTRLGLRKEEMRNNATENPIMMEVLAHVEEIKKLQLESQNSPKD
ncbi:MAG: hypothetical protein KDD99_08035 [Bacteroidetes bacterium]|nr:hypothetical protein [Bacteroidota bacterium]